MKKIHYLAIALGVALSLFSCSKKEDAVSPSQNVAAVQPKYSKQEFQDKVRRIAEAANPIFVKTSSNTATFTSSSQSGTIHFSGNTTVVKFNDNKPAVKFTVQAPVFTTTGASVYKPGSAGGSGSSSLISGAQQTLVIEITQSNVDRFEKLITGNIFASLFDTTTTDFFEGSSSNTTNFVFAPKLNTDSLPEGAMSFVTVPTVTNKGEAKSLFLDEFGSSQVSSAKLIAFNNQAGVFEMQQDSIFFAELAPGFSMLIAGVFNGGNKLIYNGTTYEGFALNNANDIDKPAFFNFLFGLGAGDASKVSGIQIGWGIDPQGQKAVLVIGVFGDIQVPQ